MTENAITEKQNWKKNPLFITFCVYSITWVITAGLGYLFWGAYLPAGDAAYSVLAFILPLVLVELITFWSMRGHEHIFQWVQWLFLILLIFVFCNTFFFHIPLMNYGDNGYLSNTVKAGRVFPRWMLGSSILNSMYTSWLFPFIDHNLLPIANTADIYIRISGCVVMIASSLFLMRRYPNRLMILLPLSTPIWLLLASGYNEYYPFMAPVFLWALLVFFEWKVEETKPILMGLLVAAIGLLYAGFLPICAFLLFLYLRRAGLKAAFQASVFSGLWVILLVMLFWPGTTLNFIKGYQNALNLGDKNSPVSEIGKALEGTPFYKIEYAISFDNLKRQFFMLFWAGGLAPFFLLCGAIYLYFKKRQFKIIQDILFMSIFLGYELFFFIFKIPKLGLPDIDLYFQSYLTFAFIAGFLADEWIRSLPLNNRVLYQTGVYSIVAGNTGFVLLYLLFLGMPLPK
jgi:hypothetical protein